MAIAGLYMAEAKIGVVLAAFNPYWDAAMVAEMARRSKLDCLVFDGKHGDLVRQIAGEVPGLRILSMAEIEEAAKQASDAEPPLAGFNDDLMGLLQYQAEGVAAASIVVWLAIAHAQFEKARGDVDRAVVGVDRLTCRANPIALGGGLRGDVEFAGRADPIVARCKIEVIGNQRDAARCRPKRAAFKREQSLGRQQFDENRPVGAEAP